MIYNKTIFCWIENVKDYRFLWNLRRMQHFNLIAIVCWEFNMIVDMKYFNNLEIVNIDHCRFARKCQIMHAKILVEICQVIYYILEIISCSYFIDYGNLWLSASLNLLKWTDIKSTLFYVQEFWVAENENSRFWKSSSKASIQTWLTALQEIMIQICICINHRRN